MQLKFDQDSLNVTMPWCAYGHVSMLEKWAHELKAIHQSEDPSFKAWRLTGRAVMIAHPDKNKPLELVSKAAYEAEMNFVAISAEKFVDCVINNKVPAKKSPALIYVPQGEWSAHYEKPTDKPEHIKKFRRSLQTYLEDISPKLGLVFVTSGDSYDNLDSDLRAVGAFDRRFNVSDLTIEEKGTRFLNAVGVDLCDKTLLDHPAKVGKLIVDEFGSLRRQRLISLSMQRRAHRESRNLNFDDLVYFSVFGGGETDHPQETNPEVLKRIAIHEAGHAVVAVLDSDFMNIPDYAGIVSSTSFGGLVTDSFAFNLSHAGHIKFKDVLHRIRVMLAGRVAEAVALGPENVSFCGARSDLVQASAWAKDVVSRYGFGYNYGKVNPKALNLLVIDETPTASESAFIEKECRRLLNRLYNEAESILVANKVLLESLADLLVQRKALTQQELLSAFASMRATQIN
ncbi:MAG: hypothetical protein ACOYBW_05510 [Fluviibacter phosphoraccumulans]